MIGGDIAAIALVLAVQAQVLRVSGVPGGIAIKARGDELEVLDFLGHQHGAIEHVRQQTAIVILEQRQVRQQRAILEHGLRHAHLGGQAELGILILGTTGIAAGRRQQTAVAVGGAGVQFHTQHAQCIETKADSTFGVTRLHIEDKALRGFLTLGGALGAGAAAIAKIAIEVHRTRFQFGAAVFNKTASL